MERCTLVFYIQGHRIVLRNDLKILFFPKMCVIIG